MKATADKPGDRYQSADELGRDLVDFVVASDMRLSDEVLADFISKLVELEAKPGEVAGAALDEKPVPLRAEQTGEVESVTQALDLEDGRDSGGFDYHRPTVVLETGEEPALPGPAEPDDEDELDGGDEASLPTLEEISQRRKQRLRATTAGSALESVPVLDQPKARRLHWRLIVTLLFAVAAAVFVAEMLIQL